MNTIAARYNEKALELMPHMIADLKVDPKINKASHIDDIVFRRSEFLGGMAAVILALVEKDAWHAHAQPFSIYKHAFTGKYARQLAAKIAA